MPQMKKVKVLVTDTFYKFVNVEVPVDLDDAADIEEYVENSGNVLLLDARSTLGIEGDIGSAMDYEKRITLQEEE